MTSIAKLSLFVLMLTGLPSYADGFGKLAAVYLSSSTDDGSAKSESTRTLYELNGAYVWPKGWAVGAIYAAEKEKGGDITTSRTSMGPSFGWITRKEYGAYLMAHYLFKSEYEKYEGDGYQADLGFKFSIRKLALGLQVSYKSFTYKKLSGMTMAAPFKQTKVDPYFAFIVEF